MSFVNALKLALFAEVGSLRLLLYRGVATFIVHYVHQLLLPFAIDSNAYEPHSVHPQEYGSPVMEW